MSDSIRVLHVEDDPAMAEVTSEFLKSESDNIEIVTEETGEDGFRSFKGGDFDCVVSDYDMPDMNGLELLREIRGIDEDVPFILFTGKGSEEIASKAVTEGVSDYLQKRGGGEQYELLTNRIENLVSKSRAETSYREIFDKATVGMTVRDKETGELVDVNQEYCEMLGYSREEVLELSMDEISADDEAYTQERAHKLIQKATEEGPQRFEWLDETKEGEHIWVEVTLRVAEIRGRERVLASIRNITDRKKEKERFQALIENAADITLVLNDDGKITYVSPSVERILGYRPDAIEGTMGIEYIDPEKEEEVVEKFRRIVEEPEYTTEKVRHRFRDRDGDWRWFETIGSNKTDTAVDGYVFNMREITKMVEQKEELERQNERLDKFASLVSHDLKSPLTVAEAKLELLESEYEGENGYIEDIRNAHQRMEEITENVLTLARQGRTVKDKEKIKGDEIAEKAWRTVETRDADLKIEEGFEVRGDEERLRVLFENLYKNSVEHGSPSNKERGDGSHELGSQTHQNSIENTDRVTVKVGGTDDGFYVEDNGPGIPEDRWVKVFEHGYSTNESTGLGLSIVKEISEAHGWKTRIKEGENGGARFEFSTE